MLSDGSGSRENGQHMHLARLGDDLVLIGLHEDGFGVAPADSDQSSWLAMTSVHGGP